MRKEMKLMELRCLLPKGTVQPSLLSLSSTPSTLHQQFNSIQIKDIWFDWWIDWMKLVDWIDEREEKEKSCCSCGGEEEPTNQFNSQWIQWRWIEFMELNGWLVTRPFKQLTNQQSKTTQPSINTTKQRHLLFVDDWLVCCLIWWFVEFVWLNE